MKKSLLVFAMCLCTLGTYAQDDDVYFVPSSKKTTTTDTYTAPGRSTYSTIANSDDSAFEQSHWADNRGNGRWDVDSYNRRGKSYKNSVADTTTAQQSYDQGYDDGYEDGQYTSRIVRFWSPRVGVYVSSPYYWDYCDLYYDPFYYGYGSPWNWGWSGWYGWGSWYGWRPYYSWNWGWGGWYDPWHGPDWGWGWHGGGSHWAWHPSHPINAERGPVGGWVSRGGAQGVGAGRGFANASTGRGNVFTPNNSRSDFNRSNVGNAGRAFTNSGGGRSFNSNYNSGRTFNSNSNSGRTFTPNNNSGRSNSNSNRSFTQPSRSSSVGSGSMGGGRSFGTGGGGRSFGGGGGGRSFGGGGRGR